MDTNRFNCLKVKATIRRTLLSDSLKTSPGLELAADNSHAASAASEGMKTKTAKQV